MNTWSPDIECVLEAIRQNSVVIANEHKKQYVYLNGLLRYFKLPVIVLSAINSVVAISPLLQDYMSQPEVSMLNCGLSLICGIIGSIELYLGINSNMQKELESSKNFYLLSVEIYKVLSLKSEHRVESGYDFLNTKYKDYTQLISESNVIVKRISDRLTPLPNGDMSSLSTSSTNLAIESDKNIVL